VHGDIAGLFSDPPKCYIHRQGSFITSYFPPRVSGNEYAFFPFPPIDLGIGNPGVGGAEIIVMFEDTPQARALMEYLVTTEAQQLWVEQGGFISTNQRVSMDQYPDDLARYLATAVLEIDVFRFDGSELMPPEVGMGSFHRGLLEYIAGYNLELILEEIEISAADTYE